MSDVNRKDYRKKIIDSNTLRTFVVVVCNHFAKRNSPIFRLIAYIGSSFGARARISIKTCSLKTILPLKDSALNSPFRRPHGLLKPECVSQLMVRCRFAMFFITHHVEREGDTLRMSRKKRMHHNTAMTRKVSLISSVVNRT